MRRFLTTELVMEVECSFCFPEGSAERWDGVKATAYDTTTNLIWWARL